VSEKKLRLVSAISLKLVEPLGAVVANFSVLSFSLELLIWLFLTGEFKAGSGMTWQGGRIITAEMSFKNLIHAFGSLWKLRFPDNEDGADDLVAMLWQAE